MVESANKKTEVGAQKITITPQEQKLFDTLMTIVKANNLQTTLRVAGGWVRDKVSTINTLTICAATWQRK